MATVQQPQQTTTQLEFHQAMADFKTMFPDMEDEVIEAVLRANQGAVDATIDQLLGMSTDNENEKLRNELEQTEVVPASHPLVALETLDLLPPRSPAMRTLKDWCPPLLGPLPDDFLRLPSSDSRRRQPAKELEAAYLEDERIALFLQNEEFMAELRWNKDFLSTLEKDRSGGDESPADEVAGARDEDAVFKERLRNMGKMSQRKFAQLAKVFTRRKKRTGTKSVGPARDRLLDEEDSGPE